MTIPLARGLPQPCLYLSSFNNITSTLGHCLRDQPTYSTVSQQLEWKPEYSNPDCSLATASCSTAATPTGRASSVKRQYAVVLPVLLESIAKTCDQEQGMTQNSLVQNSTNGLAAICVLSNSADVRILSIYTEKCL